MYAYLGTMEVWIIFPSLYLCFSNCFSLRILKRESLLGFDCVPA